jgi:hypothetical protein
MEDNLFHLNLDFGIKFIVWGFGDPAGTGIPG